MEGVEEGVEGMESFEGMEAVEGLNVVEAEVCREAAGVTAALAREPSMNSPTEASTMGSRPVACAKRSLLPDPKAQGASCMAVATR